MAGPGLAAQVYAGFGGKASPLSVSAAAKLGFLANPYVQAAVVFGTPIINALLRPKRKVVDQFVELANLDAIHARYAYGGPVDIPGTYGWSNSRLIEVPFGAHYGAPQINIKRQRILDRIVYLSEGELDSLTSIKLDNDLINLEKLSGRDEYIPSDTTSKYYGKFFVTPYFASTSRPMDLETNYGDKAIDWKMGYHDPNVSYLHIGFMEVLEAQNSQTEIQFWTRRGIPQSISTQGKAMKVFDLSKYPNHGSAPKVWTNNPISILYDYLIRKSTALGQPLTDDDFDWHWMLEGYAYCGQRIENDYDLYAQATGVKLPYGQIAESVFANYPRHSKQYSFSGVIDSADDSDRETEDVLNRFKAAYLGDLTDIGGKIAPIVGRFRNPRVTIRTDDWVDNPVRTSQPNVENLYNTLTIRHQSQTKNYRVNEIEIKNDFAIERDGREIPAPSTIEIHDCTDEAEIYRKGNNILRVTTKKDLVEGSIIGRLDAVQGETLAITIDETGIQDGVYLIREYRYDRESNQTRLELEQTELADFSNDFRFQDGSVRAFLTPQRGILAAPDLGIPQDVLLGRRSRRLCLDL